MAAFLIVDDDLDVAELLKQLLEEDGHEVRLANNGEEGLRQLAMRLPDVVLLDIQMPILDGPGMAYRMFIRDLGMEQIPIVLSSGAAYASAIAEEIGTPYRLGKPYGYDELSQIIQRALSERTAPTPRFAVMGWRP
jgi:DNA-binding NtrC family response regulator